MIDLLLRVLDFAVPILIMIFIGLWGAGLLIELGLMKKLSRLTRPLLKHTNLPESCGSAFLVAIGSTAAANSMVVQAKDKGCVNDREAILCALLNSTPAYVRGIITYQIPIILPALGPVVGGFYVMVFIISAVVKFSVVIILSKFWIKKQKNCTLDDGHNGDRPPLKQAMKASFKKEKKLFLKIATIYLGMTTLVFALRERGFFEIFSVLPLADLFGIPSESIIPLTTYIASPILGVSLLGPMIGEGSISYLQAMIVIMLGSMFMLPIFSIRTLLPRYISIFGPKLGVKIVTISTGMSILIRFTILIILLSIV
ncbi:nucleoside recognition domain-containing protein [Methanohalophilus profundi]|uniref:nucleoside recognition domain-containing protein n=1 Tax=Methanohalophilus profundi TaxID=2138083 RepID=UPI00101C3EDF|nr:nucleoside recognition domain-containing protein [Methanohalophilus profundi]